MAKACTKKGFLEIPCVRRLKGEIENFRTRDPNSVDVSGRSVKFKKMNVIQEQINTYFNNFRNFLAKGVSSESKIFITFGLLTSFFITSL